KYLVDPVVRATILVGFLGGFTTFSSFAVQSFNLLRDGEVFLASANILISNVAGFVFVWVWYSVSRALLGLMKNPEEGYLLRIFVGESDKHGHLPLYEAIVVKAREMGLAGATVLRGVMGFGRHSVMHTAKILRLSEDLPMIVEIIDSLENIETFLPI